MHSDVSLQLIGQYQMKALIMLMGPRENNSSDVSLQLIGQYRMKALMFPRENNRGQGK